MIKVLDLFSGIGGNSLALQGLANTVAYCEFDKHAQAVLKSRMADGLIPNAPIFPDVTTLKGSDVGGVDMIVGGFPCQDISCAGKGAGIAEGTRSGLFYQIMRLTDELQPRFLFLENVPAIRKRGLDIVLRELTQRRYDCRWTMLSASEVGAHHRRERWFLLARKSKRTASDANRQRLCYWKQELEGFKVSPDHKGTSLQRGDSPLADASSQRVGENSEQYLVICNQSYNGGTAQSSMGGMVDGFSNGLVEGLPDYLRAGYWEEEPCERVTQEREQRVERIKRLGNAVVPLQARMALFKLMSGMV
jgi:DNA-cytosine methyltransferase